MWQLSPNLIRNTEGGWNRQPCPDLRQARIYFIYIFLNLLISYSLQLSLLKNVLVLPYNFRGPQLDLFRRKDPKGVSHRVPLNELRCAPGDIARVTQDSTC